jgi:hypothetical protein
MAAIDVLVAGFITISLFSYLWRDNIFFRMGENIFVGYAAGYSVAFQYEYLMKNVFEPLGVGQFGNLIPFLIGLLFFAFFSDNNRWLYKYPIAIVTGGGIGLAVAGAVRANFLNQIKNTLLPLWTGNVVSSVTNIIIVTGVVGVLWYFVFTLFRGSGSDPVSSWGRWVMMAGFGVTFGLASAARVARFIDRVADVYRYPSYYLIPVAFVLLAYGIYRDRQNQDIT